MARVEFRCTDSERELYVQAAGAAGVPLSVWIRSRLAAGPSPEVRVVGDLVDRRLAAHRVSVPPSGVASVLAKRFG